MYKLKKTTKSKQSTTPKLINLDARLTFHVHQNMVDCDINRKTFIAKIIDNLNEAIRKLDKVKMPCILQNKDKEYSITIEQENIGAAQ